MAYVDHFKLADDFVAHLDGALAAVTDPFLRSRYIGFVAISAATVYELAIKEIFAGFSEQKHKVLGTFVRRYFDRLNGQIGRDRLEGMYLPLFGEKYVKKFKSKLEKLEIATLRTDGVSIKASYANLLTWRHAFAHVGTIPATATYDEVKKAYLYGRRVIDCLDDAMRR